MLGVVICAIAASFVAEASSEILFAECPDTYTHLCFHGTCRFLVSESTASCICFKGYIGNRCQKMDWLEVITGYPHSFIIGAFLVVLTLIGSVHLCHYLYIRKAQSELTNLVDV